MRSHYCNSFLGTNDIGEKTEMQDSTLSQKQCSVSKDFNLTSNICSSKTKTILKYTMLQLCTLFICKQLSHFSILCLLKEFKEKHPRTSWRNWKHSSIHLCFLDVKFMTLVFLVPRSNKTTGTLFHRTHTPGLTLTSGLFPVCLSAWLVANNIKIFILLN